jgi:SanA protein
MTRKRFAVLALIFLLSLIAIIGAADVIQSSTKGRIFSDITLIPHRRVGLLLGCSRTLSDGRQNLFFRNRINAAINLFKARKVEYLLVSGDNRKKGYDEATEMKESLMRAGIPANRIYCDFAGFRTLDSVVRARDVFCQNQVTIISQEFHNRRAIFIATHHGIDAIGFNAAGVDAYNGFMTNCREQLARVRTLLDIYLFRKSPKFLGQRIEIGIQPPVSPGG